MRDIMRFRVLAMVLLALGLFAGSFSAAGAQGDDSTDPGATPPPVEEPGSVVISKFVCTQIEEPTATISDPVGVAAGTPDEGCVADSADFQIFVNSDFTSDPIDVFVDGTATVNGVPATVGDTPNALFEPAFNVFFEFFIEPGGVTTITVLNPADDGDGATPVLGVDDADDKKDGDDGAVDGVADDGTDDKKDGDDGAVDGVADDGTDDDGSDDGEPVAGEQEEADEVAGEDEEGGVSALPSTGQGSNGGANGSAIVLLFGALSMVALAGGFAWRQRRSA